MTDLEEPLVDRLRRYRRCHDLMTPVSVANTCDEAAAEIERLRAEISASWQMLEEFGFPPEACGWPFQSIVGELPNAIRCALECIIRQRDEAERQRDAMKERAAKACDDMRIKHGSPVGDAYSNGVWDQGIRDAAAIRVLPEEG